MHLDVILFVLLMATAGVFRLLTKAASSTGKSDPPAAKPTPPPRIDRAYPGSMNTDEERIRRFMEALGQAGSRPPPPAVPRSHIPPRPLAPVKPPPGMFPIPAWKPSPKESRKPAVVLEETAGRDSELRSRAIPLIENQPLKAAIVEAPIYEIQRGATVGEGTPAVPVASEPSASVERPDIASLLQSPLDLRNAIILREIFGAPRGLQAFDFAAGSA